MTALPGARGVALALFVLAVPLDACAGADGQPATAPAAPASAAAAAPATAPAAESSVTLLPPGRDPVMVTVEVARQPEERRLGLMNRRSLDADRGMLFLFERPEQLTFWMHNTYVSLDMIFIEPGMTVLGVVENAEPLTDTSRSVSGLSQYVLEVNAGFSRSHGVRAGTAVRFLGVQLPGEAVR